MSNPFLQHAQRLKSGIGQELGRAGVEAYTQTKAVGIKF
jgi:acyl-CoA reductase-like NAD-dependent aldehyde dehydrogenase